MLKVSKLLFEKLRECDWGACFLERNYSLELLCVLIAEGEVDGVERLYRTLQCPTPKFPAFLNYLRELEERGCIERYVSKGKRSRRGVRLTQRCYDEISGYLTLVDSSAVQADDAVKGVTDGVESSARGGGRYG